MLKTDFFRFFRFIGSWWSVKPLKLTTKIVIKTIIISGRSASQPWASCCLKSSLKLSDRIQPPAPVLLSNELNFASLARIELDQCLLNWPRPAGLSRNFGLLDQGGPPCVGPNYLDLPRSGWSLNCRPNALNIESMHLRIVSSVFPKL